MTADVLTR
jgi:hypothetical protein